LIYADISTSGIAVVSILHGTAIYRQRSTIGSFSATAGLLVDVVLIRIGDLCREIAAVSNEDREVIYLFQRLSVCPAAVCSCLIHDLLFLPISTIESRVS